MSKEKAKTPPPKTQLPQRLHASNFRDLRLYIAGRTANSVAALDNLKRLCEERFKDQYRLMVSGMTSRSRRAIDTAGY